MKVSYCTTCHGRLWQLEKTLPDNLAFTQSGVAELFIVIYNDDSVEQYLLDNFKSFIDQGRLRYLVVNDDQLWNAGYVKNIAHMNAIGDIVFNLDADNFIDSELATVLLNLKDDQIVTLKFTQKPNFAGAVGRIGMSRAVFTQLNGYRVDIASHHDGDLVKRSQRLGLRNIPIECKTPPIDNPFQVCVVGCGYVGLGSAILLNHLHKALYDIVDVDIPETITKYRQVRQLPACPIYVICVPTPEKDGSLDTTLIDALLEKIKHDATIVIRSTTPIGYCKTASLKFKHLNIVYIPEFFREKHMEHDIYNPDRVIVAGGYDVNIFNFDTDKVQRVGYDEAESIKLLSNAYLAMRLVFFNDVKKFSVKAGLNFDDIVHGVTSDRRIGNLYNSEPFIPSGKCLPKDTVAIANSIESALLDVVIDRVVFDN